MKNYKHNCPLRNKIIGDGDCFETVMAVLGNHAKSYIEKIKKDYPKCEEICSKCKYNKEKEK